MSTNHQPAVELAVESAATPAPFYRSVGDEVDVFRARRPARTPCRYCSRGRPDAGKTRFVEADGARTRSRTDHRGRPRGHDVGGSCGPLPAQGRRNRLGGRTADTGGPPKAPSAISTRSSRRVRTPPWSSIRWPITGVNCRWIGSAPPCPRRRVPTGHLLQPRLPEHPEEHQGIDPPAVRSDRTRLPARRHRSRGGRSRGRDRHGERQSALVRLGNAIRGLQGSPLREASSTRMLILAGGLDRRGPAGT